MIASDVDGTLNNSNHIITQGNIQAIKRAMKAGIKVVLCSGRTPISLSQYAEQAGLNGEGCYAIGFNGASVYEIKTKKKIFEACIAKEKAIEIIKIVKKICLDVNTLVYVKEDYIIAETVSDILEERNNIGIMKVEKADNIIDAINSDITKVMFLDDREKLEYINKKIKELGNESFNFVFTGPDSLEALPLNINKLTGINRLIKHLDISIDEVVAFGDNYNDIEMVKESGFGIAISNAVEPLKEVADYVTKRDNNNDAMIEVVDKVIEMN